MTEKNQVVILPWEGDVKHEILPPVISIPVMLNSPDLSQFRDKIIDALSIPRDLTAGRLLQFEIQFVVIPMGIKTTIQNL